MSGNVIRMARWVGPLGCAACLLLVLPSSCSDAEISDKSTGNNGSGQGGSNDFPTGSGGGSGTSSNGAGGSTAAGGAAGTNTAGNGGNSGGNGGSSGQTGGAAGTGGARRDGGADSGARADASPGTGGAGGARSDGGSGGSAGSSGAGGGLAPQCLNGRKDGDETGVDCGGSCPTACPNYKINGPNRTNNVQSSCDGGSGYMCARSMVFSPEFKQAAMDDWGMDDPPFVYGTVGHDPDNGGVDGSGNTCCQCYQLVFESPVGATGLPIPKPMIVQAFNTAAGGPKNFDIYMAAGGFGANNGCTGGSSAMYSTYPDLGGNFSGGVKATRYSQCSANGQYSVASISTPTCQSFVASQCTMIQSTSSVSNQSTSQGSCEETNFPESHYHINWNVRAKRVECPANLTRVTGCKLNSQGLPAPTPTAQNVSTADSSFRTGYQTTTMQDCCRPTCAYAANVSNTDPTYSVFYTCDKAGNPQ